MHPARLALIALALLALAAPAHARPGGEIGSRIINGSDAPAGAWPSIAYLAAGVGSLQWACGGTVVAPRVILTAAHCTMNESGTLATVGIARPGVLLRADTSTQRSWAAFDVHPGYDPLTGVANDVALVVLNADTAAPPMPLVAPWQDGLVVGGASAAVAGWGRTVNGGASSATLRQATIPLIADADCARVWGEEFDAASMVCAGDVPMRIDTCQGDSGGPLVLTVGASRVLVGDTSWGSTECASGTPGVYGRLSAFRSWILDPGTAEGRVRAWVAAQTATASGLSLTSTGPDVTVAWAVDNANWSTTGFAVSVNGAAATTVGGPTLTHTQAVPGGGAVTAAVTPIVALGSAQGATITATPTPTRAPVVTGNVLERATGQPTTTARVGAELTIEAASDDPWGQPVAYEWRANGQPIAGATGRAFRPTAALAGTVLSVRAAAANAVGTGEFALSLGRVRQLPQVVAGRIRVTGTAAVGGRLRARAPAVGGFPRPRATYRFLRDGRPAQSGPSGTYRVRERDRGATITGTATWRNAAGAVTRRLVAVRIAD